MRRVAQNIPLLAWGENFVDLIPWTLEASLAPPLIIKPEGRLAPRMPLHHNRSDVEFGESSIGEDLVFAALNIHLQNIDLLTE
jgi:hypothetical protein